MEREGDIMSNKATLVEVIRLIRATAEKIESDSRFKVKFEEYLKLDDDDLTAWELWIQKQPDLEYHRIPWDLRTVYSECGGFIFQWQYLPAKPKIVTGSAELVTILSLYQRDDKRGKPISAIYDTPRPFDVISDSEYVGILFSPASTIRLVHVDEEENTMKPLALNPIEYIRMLWTYRAIYGWQTLFLAEKKPSSALVARLKKQVKDLFCN